MKLKRKILHHLFLGVCCFLAINSFFAIRVNAQITVAGNMSNLTVNMAEGAPDQAVLGFSVIPSANVTLNRIRIVNATANITENFIAGTYEMGTCPTSTYRATDFTVVPSNAVTVANPIDCNMLMPLTSGVTYYFFFRVDVKTSATFALGYPVTSTFSIANTDAIPFRNSSSGTVTTNVFSVSNIVTPLNLAVSGIAYQWTDIPAATPLSDVSIITRTRLNDRDTSRAILVTDPITGVNDPVINEGDDDIFNTTDLNYLQAFGIVWPTAQASVSSVKFYNGNVNTTSPDDDGYFDSAPLIQYSTNGTTWIAAPGTWAVASPNYPVSVSLASYTTYYLAGQALTNVRGIRIIGKTHPMAGSGSWRVHFRELEASNRRTYYFKPIQSTLTNLTNWGINPSDGTGTAPTGFNLQDLYVLTSPEVLTGDIISSSGSVFQVGFVAPDGSSRPGVTLTMGAFTVSNAVFNIPLASSGSNTLRTTGTLPVLGNLSTGVLGNTIEFNGTTQTVPQIPYNYLRISNNGTKTLVASTTVGQDLTVTGGISGTPSKLALVSNTLTLNGTFSGGAFNNLSADGSSNLTIGGTGALGTLFFDQLTAGRSKGADATGVLGNLSAGTTNRFNNFTINRTSSGTLTLGNEMQISNVLTPTAGTLTTGGNLVMVSTEFINSSILAIPLGVASISGDVVVQSFFKGSSVANNRGFRMISMPVIDVAAPSNLFKKMQERFIITGQGGPGPNGFDFNPNKAPNAPTITRYVETGAIGTSSFSTIPNISTLTTPGQGYYFFFRGNRSGLNSPGVGKINEPFFVPEDWTAAYIGNINTGNVPIAVTRSTVDAMDGINLVGNPYPGTIDFQAFRDDASNVGVIADYFSIMKRDRTGFITQSGRVTNGINEASVGSGGSQGSTIVRYIQPGQGFFVRATANGTVTFRESHKANSTNSPNATRLLSVKGEAALAAPRKLIRMNIVDGSNRDDATVVLEPGNVATFGGNDAPYISNASVACYTLTSDDKPACINFMPSVEELDSLQIFVTSGNSKTSATLNFSDLTGAGYKDVELVDRHLGKIAKINDKANSYAFEMDKAKASSFGKDRFVLRFVRPAIQLGNFTARVVGNAVELKWETLSELSSASIFEVERSLDGTNFEVIGIRKLMGNTGGVNKYNMRDGVPPTGKVYYRLKFNTPENSHRFSNVEMVDFGLGNGETVAVYPNPTDGELNVTWKTAERVNISIYDLSGRLLKTFRNREGKYCKIDLGDLDKGAYILKLKGNNNEVGTSKFLKI